MQLKKLFVFLFCLQILLFLVVVYLATIECSDRRKKTEGNNGKHLKQSSKHSVKSNRKYSPRQGVKHASKHKAKQRARRKITRPKREKIDFKEYDLNEVIKEYIKQKKNRTRILKSLHSNGRRQLSSSTKNNKPHLLPKDLKPDHFAEFQIPNPKFCENRQLNSAHNYFIHPWWYNYCMRINEKQEKKLGLDYTLLPMYREVLDKVQKYKKMKQQLSRQLF